MYHHQDSPQQPRFSTNLSWFLDNTYYHQKELIESFSLHEFLSRAHRYRFFFFIVQLRLSPFSIVFFSVLPVGSLTFPQKPCYIHTVFSKQVSVTLVKLHRHEMKPLSSSSLASSRLASLSLKKSLLEFNSMCFIDWKGINLATQSRRWKASTYQPIFFLLSV